MTEEPSRPDARLVVAATLASAATLGLALMLLDLRQAPVLLASLGGSCVILFGMPESRMAQPRSFLGGHLIATLAGLIAAHFFGSGPLVMTLAVAVALGLMMLTDTIHSPAGADPLIVIAAGAGWSFLIEPLGLGLAILFVGALLFHRLWLGRPYPMRER